MKNYIKIFLLILIFMLTFSLVACNNAYSEPSGDKLVNNAETDADSSSNASIVAEGVSRKLVYTVEMNITVSDLNTTGKTIVEKTKDIGGWVQTSSERKSEYSSTYMYTVRIPTEKLDEFLSSIEGTGTLTFKNTSSKDITTMYVSATARKTALENEKTALNALTLTDITDILKRTERISAIDAELGALELEINGYDSLVDYSTVEISLSTDTPQSTELSFGEKIKDIFTKSIKSVGVFFKWLVIAFIAAFPYILIIGAIVVVVFMVRYFIRKKKGLPTKNIFKRKKQEDKKEDIEDINNLKK